MRLSRILNPILYTVSGKYAQDTYGLSALTTSIPAMREVRELGALDPAEGYYKALYTKLVRERNKVSDALEEAQMALRGIEEGLS
jgi:predicted Zn-dependent protease